MSAAEPVPWRLWPRYAEHGLRVFPLSAETKAPFSNRAISSHLGLPLPLPGEGGFHLAQRDARLLSRLDGFVEQRGGAHIGVYIPEGVAIVDCDVAEDGSHGLPGLLMSLSAAERAAMFDYPVVATSSGGCHLFGVAPAGWKQGRRAELVDVKLSGKGYVKAYHDCYGRSTLQCLAKTPEPFPAGVVRYLGGPERPSGSLAQPLLPTVDVDVPLEGSMADRGAAKLWYSKLDGLARASTGVRDDLGNRLAWTLGQLWSAGRVSSLPMAQGEFHDALRQNGLLGDDPSAAERLLRDAGGGLSAGAAMPLESRTQDDAPVAPIFAGQQLRV